jgi:hypothetical protein
MAVLAQIVAWLNTVANALGRIFLVPIGALPGWLSVTLIAAATGVLMLVAYKYTSNPRALKRARDGIKADLLTLKLFKDSATVALRAQGRILLGAGKLLLLSVVPMLVMLVPLSLLLEQLGLWYQARPLRIGEEAVVTMKLKDSAGSASSAVRINPTDALEVTVGPVRVPSDREVCWNVKALREGYHRIAFHVGDQDSEKELAIGDGFMRVSPRRPGMDWSDRLFHPLEEPYGPASPIESIDIDYPDRSSWTSGTNWWIVYWFAMSMVSALCFRRVLNVNL